MAFPAKKQKEPIDTPQLANAENPNGGPAQLLNKIDYEELVEDFALRIHANCSLAILMKLTIDSVLPQIHMADVKENDTEIVTRLQNVAIDKKLLTKHKIRPLGLLVNSTPQEIRNFLVGCAICIAFGYDYLFKLNFVT